MSTRHVTVQQLVMLLILQIYCMDLCNYHIWKGYPRNSAEWRHQNLILTHQRACIVDTFNDAALKLLSSRKEILVHSIECVPNTYISGHLIGCAWPRRTNQMAWYICVFGGAMTRPKMVTQTAEFDFNLLNYCSNASCYAWFRVYIMIWMVYRHESHIRRSSNTHPTSMHN
jgi:hypothetical protein